MVTFTSVPHPTDHKLIESSSMADKLPPSSLRSSILAVRSEEAGEEADANF
jgi:hypothetical protein